MSSLDQPLDLQPLVDALAHAVADRVEVILAERDRAARAGGGHVERMSPKQVAQESGFSYEAVLRAIRRGDLVAHEPINGQLRVDRPDFERWCTTPPRRGASTRQPQRGRPRAAHRGGRGAGSSERLKAIEGGG